MFYYAVLVFVHSYCIHDLETVLAHQNVNFASTLEV